ncbi:MAG TPA: hypothetical protein VJ302_23665 [Blastocatellia bacterium]|nr:hypothetical protein [Blastocatellia bacterium]
MGIRKGLNSVEALLILVIIVSIGDLGCSRSAAGNSPSLAGGAGEPVAQRLQPPAGQPEKTGETAAQVQPSAGPPEQKDETANWLTHVSPKGGFSLRYPNNWAVGPSWYGQEPPSDPNYPPCIMDTFFTAGADGELVAECASEYFGQIYVSFEEGDQVRARRISTGVYPYLHLASRKVTVDNVEGTRETGTAMGHDAPQFSMPDLPDDTKVIVYVFYTRGRTYIAKYAQRVDEPDISRDFDLMITKTLKFNN